MARYPTFEEYRKRGNYHEGIKRCDDLLKKNASDVQLLTVKLQLLYAAEDGNAPQVLDQLIAVHPPIQDLGEIVAIEEAVHTSLRDIYPHPKTAGSVVAKIWENAFKASSSMNHKLDLLSLRYSRAIVDNRLADAQQALIQLKALQPKNRVIYMAHAAVTQLLSTSTEDLQSRLALSLARKAVKENFDDDKSLDCRVPGQIFAWHESTVDLESIANRSFKESKQVLNAFRKGKTVQVNGGSDVQSKQDPNNLPQDSLAAEVQSLRPRFADLISSSADVEAIHTFVSSSTQLLHKAGSSALDPKGRGLPDACFLSISALVRAYELSHELGHLLHAAFLAEHLLQRSPHVHEARMILVYLYMRLGLGSLAMRMFDSLKVKEIQHDTVGHALFARLSVTHPQSTRVGKRDVLDPQKRLSHALMVYKRLEEKLAETEASVLNHEQTGMLFDLRELRSSLRSSVTRRIILLEQRRVARLMHNAVGDDPAEMGPRVLANWLEVTDQRDFAATFDFGYNIERVLHECKDTLLDKQSILYGLAADCAWCIAMELPTPIKDVQNLIAELEQSTANLERLSIEDEATASDGMTASEALARKLAHQTFQMLIASAPKDADLKTSAEEVLKAMQQLNVEALVSKSDVFTERIKDYYVYLDILNIAHQACKHIIAKTKECPSEVLKIQQLAEGYRNTIVEHAQGQMKRMNAAAIKTYVERDEQVKKTVALFGEARISEFCDSICASAKEGWEGVTRCLTG